MCKANVHYNCQSYEKTFIDSLPLRITIRKPELLLQSSVRKRDLQFFTIENDVFGGSSLKLHLHVKVWHTPEVFFFWKRDRSIWLEGRAKTKFDFRCR